MTAIGPLPVQGAVIKAQNYKKISDTLYQIMIKTLVGYQLFESESTYIYEAHGVPGSK
jgi:hypothetical protein